MIDLIKLQEQRLNTPQKVKTTPTSGFVVSPPHLGSSINQPTSLTTASATMVSKEGALQPARVDSSLVSKSIKNGALKKTKRRSKNPGQELRVRVLYPKVVRSGGYCKRKALKEGQGWVCPWC